jgi:hypothetical protein
LIRNTTEPIDPACGVYLDLCSCRLWEPTPDGKFKLLGNADPRAIFALLEPIIGTLPNAEEAPRNGNHDERSESLLVTFAEAARRCGLARKTLYEWKRMGKLRRQHGLRMLGRSTRQTDPR